ncbi:hypothetical protein BSG1_14974 [Bacillus sp. SG-1]|nr:hypothetical protein BSG1_14974 [Bacillus sp. SG-1]
MSNDEKKIKEKANAVGGDLYYSIWKP